MKDSENSEMEAVDDNNNSDRNICCPEEGVVEEKTSVSSLSKYRLRPRSALSRRLCLEAEWSFGESRRHKSRSAPLSRYRRKTANARERYRMRQINTAFESLRGVLPSWVCSRRAAAEMTKIVTLRLASAYIQSLQDILDGSAPEDTDDPWVDSSIVDAPRIPVKVSTFTHQPPTERFLHEDNKQNDFISLLTGTSAHEVLHHSFDSLYNTIPFDHNEELLLGYEPIMVSNNV